MTIQFSKKIHDAKSLRNSSEAHFNLTIDGANLNIHCFEPDKQVIAQYRSGTAKFALYESHGMAYFLLNFGDIGWMDAPFHASMNPPNLAGVPDGYVAGLHHFGLAVTLMDAESDVTYGARFVTLSKEMSTRLVAVTRSQLASPISRTEYDSRIQLAFDRYTASQMARLAAVRCLGGADESDVGRRMRPEMNRPGQSEQRKSVQEFAHITLLTGHECIQRAEMVEPQAVEVLLRLIESAELTGWTELELASLKYPVQITIEGGNLTCRLCLPCCVGEKPQTAVLIAIALDAVKGHNCWRTIHEAAGGFTTTAASKPPKTPWIAAMPMLNGNQGGQFLDYLEMMQWVGDFERCLAFAFALRMVGK